MKRRKPLLLVATGTLAIFSVIHAVRSIVKLDKARELLEQQTTTVSATSSAADRRPASIKGGTTDESQSVTEQTLVRLQSLLDQARKALEEGKAKPALALYRKCLLEGKSSPAFSQSKFLEIYETLSTLTEVDPATKRILESHRRSYQERWQADNSDSHSFIQWLVLNQVLDKTQETVAVFDEHKEKRGGLTFYPKILFDALHRDKRYKDAVDVFGYHGHRHVLEAHLAAVQERPDQLPHGEALQVINKTMQGVEALAGAGQRERALELAERLMEIYPIPEVRDQIKNRLEQAGETRLASLVNQSELKKREGPAR